MHSETATLLGRSNMREAGSAKHAKNQQERKSSFRSILGLFWVKTTSLSGHHSRFGEHKRRAILQLLRISIEMAAVLILFSIEKAAISIEDSQ